MHGALQSSRNAAVVSDFVISTDLQTLLSVSWLNKCFYEKFLSEVLEDKRVLVDDWKCDGGNIHSRSVSSHHPSKINFPGMPSHAENIRTQRMVTTFGNGGRLSPSELPIMCYIHESNTFKGIPYADYFTVQTYWSLKQMSNTNLETNITSNCGISSNSDNNVGEENSLECQISISVECVFCKSTWLQSTIESNTKSELIKVFEKWREYTMKQISLVPSIESLNTSHVYKQMQINNDLSSSHLTSSATLSTKSLSKVKGKYRLRSVNSMDTIIDTVGSTTNMRAESSGPTAALLGSEEYSTDDEFFDCEEGDLGGTSEKEGMDGNAMSNAGGKSSWGLRSKLWELPQRPQYSAVAARELLSISNGTDPTAAVPMTTSAFLASLLEILLVLSESVLWQVQSAYETDLRRLFSVTPGEVLRRVVCSLMPGCHHSLITDPDVYGPCIAVLVLPQALLLIMEDVALHGHENGCGRSSLFGNSVVVAVFLWLGLAALYRLLAYLVAPDIDLIHCICITGYSFFSWSLSLVLAHVLDSNEWMGLSSSIPLLVLGGSSAVAIGFMFWEQTPLAALALPLPAPAASTRARRLWCAPLALLLRSLLWAVPKMISFALVAGTHYQFLWYVARVFLPGKRQLCRLSALMKPAQYADILTQKELRKYALLLLRKSYDSHH